MKLFKSKKQKKAEEIIYKFDMQRGEYFAKQQRKKSEKEVWPENKYKILEEILDKGLLASKNPFDFAGVAFIQSTYISSYTQRMFPEKGPLLNESERDMSPLSEDERIDQAKLASQDYVDRLNQINEMQSISREIYPGYIFNSWLKIKGEFGEG